MNHTKHVFALRAAGLCLFALLAVAASVDTESLALLELAGGAFLSVGTASSTARFMLSTDQDGTAWGALVEIEGNGAGKLLSATQLTNGLPAVAYFDTNQELHFAAPELE